MQSQGRRDTPSPQAAQRRPPGGGLMLEHPQMPPALKSPDPIDLFKKNKNSRNGGGSWGRGQWGMGTVGVGTVRDGDNRRR